MKTNYNVTQWKQRVNFTAFFFAIFTIFCCSTLFAQTVETTVFTDDFGGTNLSGGTPTTTYSIVKLRNLGTAPSDPNTTSTAGVLRVANRNASGASGINSVIGNLSVYSIPFTSKLSEILADSLVWTFNMRQNYSNSLTGFNDTQRGVATILVSDNSNLATSNGYAIVNGGESPTVRRYRLVKFTGGVDANSKVIGLLNGQTLTTNIEYMSIRVVYIPASNTWKFYDRIDGTAFASPAIGTYTLAGSTIDSDHTGKQMINFGFMNNYSGAIDLISLTDNYVVKTYKTDVGTSIATAKNFSFYKTTIVNDGIMIEAENAKATLYDSKGAIIKSIQIKGSRKIDVNERGFFILKMESENGETCVKRLIFQ